jgi:hypothetical protein
VVKDFVCSLYDNLNGFHIREKEQAKFELSIRLLRQFPACGKSNIQNSEPKWNAEAIAGSKRAQLVVRFM